MKKLLSNKQTWHYLTAFLILAGLGLRYYFIFHLHNPLSYLYSDMLSYYRTASRLLWVTKDQYFSFFPLGYSWVMSFFYPLKDFTGFIWLQWFVSILSCLLAALAIRKFSSQKLAILSFIVLLFYFPMISLTGYFLSETYISFFIALCFYLFAHPFSQWTKKRFCLIGFVIGMSAFFKGTLLMVPPLLIILTFFTHKDWLKKILIMMLGFFIFIIPKSIYIQKKSGIFTLTATNSSVNFIEGKCKSKKNTDSMNRSFGSPMFYFTGEQEEKKWIKPFTDTSYYIKEGLKCIQENPLTLIGSFRYVFNLVIDNYLWPSNFGPNQPLVFYYHYAFLILFIGYLYFIFKHKTIVKNYPFTLLSFLAIAITVYIFKSEIRYRVPFDVVFIPCALYFFNSITQKLSDYSKLLIVFIFLILPNFLSMDFAYKPAPKIQQETNIVKYIKQNKDQLLIFSIRDEATDGLTKFAIDKIHSWTGIDLTKPKYRDSMIAISHVGENIFQQQGQTLLELDYKKIQHHQKPNLDKSLKISSGGFTSTPYSSIVYDGHEYSINHRGLNILSINPLTGEVLSTASFDTYDGLSGYFLSY